MPADPNTTPESVQSNATGKNTPQRLLWSLLILVLVGIGIYSSYSWLKHEELKTVTRSLPDYGKVPEFTLTNQDNKSVSLGDLKGHIWIADLIYTHCSGSCPMITSRLASIQKSLFKTPEVKLVSISIDPDHDSPQALNDYAKMCGADTKQWSFLTGERKTILNL